MHDHSTAPSVIRTWQDEHAVMTAVRPFLSAAGRGVPLSRECADGKPVDSRLIAELAALLARLTRVRRTTLPQLPASWPADHTDSRAFLRTLAGEAHRQFVHPNWAVFGGLFKALGVPENALLSFADRVPPMSRRPFSLLHTDLRRDNLIVSDAVACTGWGAATYGDPLYDLATHLVRMRYPSDQWEEVTTSWEQAMRALRPAAVRGRAADLKHYVAFERARELYTEVMRAARSLEVSFSQRELHEASDEVSYALTLAETPLGLGGVPGRQEVKGALFRWLRARQSGVVGGKDRLVSGVDLTLDEDLVPLSEEFGIAEVRGALLAEGAAGSSQIFKGTAHLNTVVEVAGVPFPVVVRRELPDVHRREARPLYEHAVLRAIGGAGVDVRVPSVLALGRGYREERFAIQTYVGPVPVAPPAHPVNGLLPHEADALVDQLAELTKVEWRGLDPDAGARDFFEGLKSDLVALVAGLPEASASRARELGLPSAERLGELLGRYRVRRREPGLLHGDLNPWNLVRRSDAAEFTLIDWEMAVVGDPLYDLVRHMHLTPTRQVIRERMFRRWEGRVGAGRVLGWQTDWFVYRWVEIVRSAYIDLDRLVSREVLDAPNVRRAVESYEGTLAAALAVLGVRRG